MSDMLALIEDDQLKSTEQREQLIDAVNATKHFTAHYDEVIECVEIQREQQDDTTNSEEETT